MIKWKFLFAMMLPFFLLSCGNKKEVKETYPTIDVAYPEVRDIEYFLEYPGYTASLTTVELVARVSAFLESRNFTAGAIVQKGSLLFVIEPQAYKDKVSAAEADVKNFDAQLRLAKESLSRVKEAAKTQAVSEIDVVKAETAVDQAEAALLSAKSQLNIAKQNLEYCYVRAPFTGRITKSNADIGNYINAGQVLATMYEDNEIFVNFTMEDSKYIGMIQILKDLQKNKKGNASQKVWIELGGDTPKVYEGAIDYVAPNIDVSTGTFNVRAIVENKKLELRSGLYVKVRIPSQEIKDALLVRESSIGSDQSGRYVYIVNDSNRIEYKSVQVGALESDNMREITKGLQAKDRYVTKALLKVRDGMQVEPKLENAL